jgi:hypothetical protein
MAELKWLMTTISTVLTCSWKMPPTYMQPLVDGSVCKPCVPRRVYMGVCNMSTF